MRTLILPAILLTVAVHPAHAQECPTQPALGTVTGTVVDEATGLALANAEVSVVWRLAGAERPTTREVEADGTGRFTLCDVQPGTTVFARAKFAGRESRGRSVQVDAGGTAVARLVLDAPRSRVTGRIVDDASNRPIASASVAIGAEGPTVVSAEDGRFVFEGVPPGRHGVRVSHVAFANVADSMLVELGSLTNLTVRMDANVIPLAPIVVQVRSLMLDRAGFYTRQERGAGSFLTRRDIEGVVPQLASDVLRRQPGLRMVRRQYGGGYAVVGRGNCPFRYVVNGARVGPTFQIDDMPPEWIEAIEIYRGASTVPMEFMLPPSAENADCGIIAVWTRNR